MPDLKGCPIAPKNLDYMVKRGPHRAIEGAASCCFSPWLVYPIQPAAIRTFLPAIAISTNELKTNTLKRSITLLLVT